MSCSIGVTLVVDSGGRMLPRYPRTATGCLV